MKKVSEKEFNEIKGMFLSNHEIVSVETSPMVNDSYHKIYYAKDGATMWEHSRIVTEEAEVEVKGIRVMVQVKLWETENWSTDNATSMFLYERL